MAYTVTFWGTRGSIPTPGAHTARYGGNTPCVELVCGPHTLIFDAGTGIRQLGNAVVEAANNPVTREGDHILAERGIPVVPDILANAGGVVASYVEWHQSKSGGMTTRDEVLKRIDSVLETAWSSTLAARDKYKCDLRMGSLVVAAEELIGALRDRNWI